jgi:hypothetical protein
MPSHCSSWVSTWVKVSTLINDYFTSSSRILSARSSAIVGPNINSPLYCPRKATILTYTFAAIWCNTDEVDSNTSQESVKAKHFGTFYVQTGGMGGIPNDLWRQLTTLIGNDRDEAEEDENEYGAEIDERVPAVADPSLRAGNGEETPMPGSKSDPDGGDEEEEEEGEGEGADESDDEEPVEIGVDECMMLKECLEKKLSSLISSEERYYTRQIPLFFYITYCEQFSPFITPASRPY